MEFEQDILKPFLDDLIEMYRQNIMEKEEAKELAAKQRELSIEVRRRLKEPYPELYKLVSDYTGCIFDISDIKQEQLYIQGVRDGIRLKKLIREIEEGEKC